MFRINSTNREYLGFMITYLTYLLIILSIIYYEYFILKNINLGLIVTIILISTGIIYPILYHNSLKIEKNESEK